MTLQTVKLSQLRLSPLNVRRVKPKALDQLAADMLTHGQLQNLVAICTKRIAKDGGDAPPSSTIIRRR